MTDDPSIEIEVDGKKLTREGFCSGCGFCCKVIARAGVSTEIEDDKEFAKVRGYPEKGVKWYNVYDPCPLLTAANKCSIYANRPRTCKEFPIHPLQIQDSPCTYHFYDEDGNEVNPERNYEGYEDYKGLDPRLK